MSLPQTTKHYTLPKIGSYRDLVIQESPLPPVRANEVLVKIHAVSLNYRDYAQSVGQYPGSPDNLIPCSDMAGEVIHVGSDVTEWTIGDRVAANFCTEHLSGDPDPRIITSALGGNSPGVLTEYRAFPAYSLVRIPEHLSFVEASTLPCAGVTAYNALHGPNPVKAGDTVLVLGTGGVSIFALQFAVAAGATVIATSSSDDKLALAKKLGAKHLINYKTTPEWHLEVLKITNNRGVDHVIEVGGGGTLFKSSQAVRIGGNISIIGHVAAGTNETASQFVFPVIGRSILVRGIFIGSVSLFREMNRLIEAHPETTRPVVDKVFQFEQAVEAWEYLEAQKFVGKIVIQVSKD